jgi:hypothetical protein
LLNAKVAAEKIAISPPSTRAISQRFFLFTSPSGKGAATPVLRTRPGTSESDWAGFC